MLQFCLINEMFRALLVVFVATASASRSDVPHEVPIGPQGCPLVPTLLHAAGFSPTCVAGALAGCHASQDPTAEKNTFVQELKDTMADVKEVLREAASLRVRPRNCRDLQWAGDQSSGQRQVFPYTHAPDLPVTVLCDQDTDGGGWTVFQRRLNVTDREDFYRTWVEYQLGFGLLEGEFWLGLDVVHQLTQQSLQEMRVDLEDYEGNHAWAKYGFFHVDDAAKKYRLQAGRYSGTAGDGLGVASGRHHGYVFSTHDQDNDAHGTNCALTYKGAWWYDKCHITNLNGHPHQATHESYADGINWNPWKGYYYSLRATTMKLRPAFYNQPQERD